MPNNALVNTAVIQGVTPVPIGVECSIGEGLPSFDIIGIRHDHAVELAAIVRCAILASGYTWPQRAVTVSLAPLDMPKRGSHLSLPIAVAVLAASGQIRLPKHTLFVGELGLDGLLIQDTRGIVAYARLAADLRMNLVCPCFDALPSDYVGMARGITGLACLRGDHVEPIHAIRPIPASADDGISTESDDATVFDMIYDDVIAGRGGLIVTPPELIRHIAPAVRAATLHHAPLTPRDALDCACIASVAGEPDIGSLLGLQRPFRSPDPSISLTGLLGGGMPVRPGEISLANHGVLYLGDVGCWKPSTLKQLAAIKENGGIRIVRQDGAIEMPARFQMFGYILPCPCGYSGHHERDCTCEAQQFASWQRKIDLLRPMFGTLAYL